MLRSHGLWMGLAVLAGCSGGEIPTKSDTEPVTETDSEEPEVDAVSDVSVALVEDYESLVRVRWTQTKPGDVTIRYVFGADDEEGESPTLSLEAGTYEQVLVGIPYGQDFLLTVGLEGETSFQTAHYAGSTGERPDDLPALSVMESDPDGWDPTGEYLLGSVNLTTGGWVNGIFWAYIIDRQGRVLWAHEVNRGWTLYPQRSQDGTHLLIDSNTFWSAYDEGADSVVERLQLDGTELETVAMPGLHHSFLELEDGSLLWGAASWTQETLEELSPDGEQRTVWDCADFMAEMGERGSCQSNSMFHDAEKDTVLFSFYTLEEVVEIDRATGETLKPWGRMDGSWSFDPEWSEFIWQHGPSITEDGTFLISSKSPDEVETVVYEYEVNEETETLELVWSFGEGEGILARTNGEAHRLPSGNTLHNYGSAGRIREVTPEGVVVWDVNWQGERMVGRTTFIDNLYDLLPAVSEVSDDGESK